VKSKENIYAVEIASAKVLRQECIWGVHIAERQCAGGRSVISS
jgi:hypothetical protein